MTLAAIEETVAVDGLNIRILEQGEGRPLLLLHGGTIGFSADMWRRNLAAFAKAGFRAIAYDQPGYGESDDPSDFALAYRQSFIVKLLDALGLASAAWVGHSQAGGLAVGAALAAPPRCERLVVLGTGSLLPPLAGAPAGKEPTQEDAAPTIADTRALLEANLYDHAAITPALLADYHRRCIGRHVTNAARRARAGGSAARDGAPLWQRLGELAMPAMFIYGRDDRGKPSERVPLAQARYTATAFHLLDKCHHIVQWDRAEEFQRLTLEFLRAKGQ
jgi:4,5:9,10-diseco-3-hydroxy-5,9,17-trioxoandrosta-1(10),2-diene-4-oate hydrolase